MFPPQELLALIVYPLATSCAVILGITADCIHPGLSDERPYPRKVV